MEQFDTYRFGTATEVSESVIINRIEQAFRGELPSADNTNRIKQAFREELPVVGNVSITAFASLPSRPAIKFPIIKAKPIVTASLAVPPDADVPAREAEIIPPVEEKSKRAKTKSTIRFPRSTKKTRTPRSTRERQVFRLFKKKPKIPDGVNLKANGYKAVHKAALKHGVDVNFALRVARQESRGNCNATSSANAKGVMQVIPGTARKHGVRHPNTLYNCKIGADIGVRELKSCLKMAGGNRVQALVCYNAGPAWITSHKYRGRRIPAETRDYIKKITGKSVAKVT